MNPRLSLVLGALLLVGSRPIAGSLNEIEGLAIARKQATDTTARNADVLSTVDRFFAAMAAGDVAASASILHPDGVMFSQPHPGDGAGTLRHRTNAEWLEGMQRWTQRFEEHTSGPSVLMRGPIAVVWQSYKVKLDGRFSHCGVNILSLVKSDGSWWIASIVWTVEQADCPS